MSGENNAVQKKMSRQKLKEEFFERLAEVQREDAKNRCVINYYGERGGGKSWFAGDLRREARENGYTVLELDFSSGRLEPEDALECLMRDLEEKKINFKKCGEVMRKLGRSWDVKLPRKKAVAAVLIAIIVPVVFGLVLECAINRIRFIQTEALPGVVKLLVKLLSSVANVLIGAFGFTVIKPWAREKALKCEQKKNQRKLRDEYKGLDFKEKEDLREHLPELFAKDVNEWRKEARRSRGETLCIFIDAYDARKNDDRWLYGEHGLCRHLDHAIFVVTGEEKLLWENGDENRDKFWKGGPHGTLVCREINKPGEEESKKFLEDGGVASKDLRDTLYKYTDGWPELLDKWCKTFAPGDESGDLSKEQREKLAEWVKAFIEDHWHVKITESVYLMAGMRRWTRELLECAMWASGVGINDDIEDVMKALGAEGLITRESADVYSMKNDMKNESIRIILSRNTILEQPQRVAACKALLKTHTAIGAEAAYYLWKEDKKGKEDKKTWAKDLAARLKLHAEDLANANNANERADTDAMARVNEIYRHRPDVIEDFQRIQREEQEEKRQALFKQIDRLYEEAVDVYTTVLGEDDNIRLATMNYRAINCNSFGEHRKAEELASEALASCEEILQKMGPEEGRKSPIDRTRRYIIEKTLPNARKEPGEET